MSGRRQSNLLVVGRAILYGLLVALPAANVWALLVLNLGVPLAALLEKPYFSVYMCGG